jgi:hypothetical protein
MILTPYDPDEKFEMKNLCLLKNSFSFFELFCRRLTSSLHNVLK